MADFNTILADVLTLLKRPDLVAEATIAVKSATLQLHRQDFFPKDLTEVTLEYDTYAYLQAIGYRQLFPRYRSLSYLRKFDPNFIAPLPVYSSIYDTNGVGPFFKIITTDQVLDSYAQQINDVAYVAGDVIQVRSSTADKFAIIGVYQNPNVASAESYTSWVADEAPYAVVYAAVAQVYGSVLKNPSGYQTNRALSELEFALIRNSNITNKGE